MKGWWPDWGGMLVPDVSPAETFLRVSAAYLGLLVLFRVVLKRQAGSLGLTDVLLVVLVSECVSPGLSGEAKSVTNGLVAAATLLFWAYAIDRMTQRWPALQRMLEPPPVALVRDGRPLQENLYAEGITPDELEAQLRLAGLEEVRQARAVMLESDGQVSVIPKDDLEEAVGRLRRAADELESALARRREILASEQVNDDPGVRISVYWKCRSTPHFFPGRRPSFGDHR